MKFFEFETQLEKLKRVYGPMKYPTERAEAIFQAVRNLPNDAFEKQVTTFIAEREKAPFLRDFIDAFSGILIDLKKQEIEEKLKNEPSCYECKDIGVSIFYLRENSISYAFQCHCKRGQLLNPILPKKYPGMDRVYFNHNEWVSGKVQKVFKKTTQLTDQKPPLKQNYGDLRKVDFQKPI